MAFHHTSMTYSPEELHAMGLEIVGQAQAEMIETGSRLFGMTDLGEIFDHLSNDPALRYQSRAEMLAHARRVVAAAEAEAPKWFATVPEVACNVEAVPGTEEAGMATAYYMPGSVDGSRPGTYYLNTSQPELRHRYGAEDIAFHEAVPGHHFQLTIAMESKDLVPARQVLFDTACAGRVGPLRRAAGRRNGPLQRRPLSHGPLRGRCLACGSARRRHGSACPRLDPPAGDRLDGRSHAPSP